MKVENVINVPFVVESHKIIFEFHFNFTNHKKQNIKNGAMKASLGWNSVL